MRKTVLCSFAATLVLLALIPTNVSAFTVAPALSDLSVKPGDSKVIDIILNNTDKESIKFWPEITDIVFNEEGIAQFMPSSAKTGNNSRFISGWTKLAEGPLILAPGKVTPYKVTLKIPPQAEPGGHYGAILFSQQPALSLGKPADIFLSTKVASLLYLDVEGVTKREFRINQFRTEHKIYTSFPISIHLELKNSGNTHLFPHGLVSVTNEITGMKMADLIVNSEGVYLMPNTQKLFKLTWDTRGLELFHPKYWGKYKISVQLAATGAPRIETQGSFWLIPVIPILLELAVLGLIFLVIRTFLKKLRSK